MEDSKRYMTRDFFEAAAIRMVAGIEPDEIYNVDGMGVLVYNDKDRLPPYKEIRPFIELHAHWGTIKRMVFETIDQKGEQNGNS